MTRFKVLLRIQMLGVFGINKILHTNDKKEKRRAAAFAVLYLLLILVALGYSTLTSVGYASAGLGEYLPPLLLMATALATAALTFMKSTGVLFGMKDYDSVMSLPVKVHEVILSRLAGVYIMNVLIGGIVMIPGCIVYGVVMKPPLMVWGMMGLILFLEPLLPMVLAFAAGTVIMAAASRFRYKNLVVVVLSMAAVLACLIGSFSMSGVDMSKLKEIGQMISEGINRIYPPAAWFSSALNQSSGSSFLLFAVTHIGAAVVFTLLLSLFFKKINSAISNHYTRSNYRMGRLRISSPFAALYKKEMKRYTSCYMYLMNTAISEVMLIALGVTLLFVSPEKLNEIMPIPNITEQLSAYLPLVMAFIVVIGCTTCSSISIEGKSRWILCSLPLKSITVFQAKMAVNLTMSLPAVLLTAILGFAGLKASVGSLVMMIVFPAAYTLFSAVFGIVINLKYPRFDWTSEYQVVKQSMAVGLNLLVGFAVVLLPVVLVIFLPSYREVIMAASAAVILAVTWKMYLGIKKINLYM